MVLYWGQMHEKSGCLTLLKHAEELGMENPKFSEVGLILLMNNRLGSSPDGLLTYKSRGDIEQKAAIEIKSSFQNGRGRPFNHIPYTPYIQVCITLDFKK